MLEALLALSAFFQASLPEVLPADDLVITSSCRIKPGIYRIPDAGEPGVLRIEGENIAVMLADVTIDGAPEGATPDQYTGTGIIVRGKSNVVWGGAVHGFKVGVMVDGGEDHWVVSLDAGQNFAQRLRSTPEAEDGADWLWPHENDAGEWASKYGAGIWVRNVARGRILECVGTKSQNGIILDRATECSVRSCRFTSLSGWGLAMWRSSDNRIEKCSFDWCVRGYSHGIYARGQDSAGILVFEQCCRNVFRGNSATHSGDGFFLYAGHETTQKTGQGGSNDNLVEGNDFSHAVANGIEATFSTGNRFVDNRLDDCNYGIWAGYSRDSLFERNVVRGCTYAGIAIEHGSGNTIRGNRIEACARGIDLWWDEDKELIESEYGRKNRTDSADTLVEGNVIRGGKEAVRLAKSARIRLLGNWIDGVEKPLVTEGYCPGIENEPAKEEIVPRVRSFTDEPGSIRGRQYIVMTEWGPYDFSGPILFPARVDGVRVARFTSLGLTGKVEAVDVTGDVKVEIGRGPPRTHLILVQPLETAGSWIPFRFTLAAGDVRLTASGALLNAWWRVRNWAWTADPREDPAAFAALLGTPPLRESLKVPGLDFRWGSGPIGDGLPADHFVTVADTEVTLPAGEYEIVTLSDDGVRVFVDDANVIDDWTWHPAKEDRAKVRFDGAAHRIRVEHFEIDGAAALSLKLRKVE